VPTGQPGVSWSSAPQAGSPAQPLPPTQQTSYRMSPPLTPSTAATAGTDLKPLIPRSNSGIVNRADQARDQIYQWMEGYAQSKALDTFVLKSTPYSPSIWVECRAWIPTDPSRTCTDRCMLRIDIRTTPFHRFEILYDVTVGVGDFTRKHLSVYELNRNDIERALDALLTGNKNQIENLRMSRIRQVSWQLWRPRNKVDSLDSTFNIVKILGWLGFICLFPGSVFHPVLAVAAVLWITAAILKHIRNRKRWHYQNQGKPQQEPRTLRQLDSWQTLIFEIGPDVNRIRQEVLAELRKGTNSGFVVETETIWYWGLDGKEEREQLVARFRRGIAFIQIYEYGQDLFVGWDAHINAGTWVEKEVAKGYKQGQMVSLRTVVAGSQAFTEYDLFDTNCLVEWVHGAVLKVIKRTMAHRKIDQEIDFKIIRGDRNVIADTTQQASGARGKIRQMFHREE
jgi:hypothetical protein